MPQSRSPSVRVPRYSPWRLSLARELMRGGMNATDACFRSGWRSYSSFTRAYAKHYGSTPTGRRDAAALADETYE